MLIDVGENLLRLDGLQAGEEKLQKYTTTFLIGGSAVCCWPRRAKLRVLCDYTYLCHRLQGMYVGHLRGDKLPHGHLHLV